MKITEKLLKQIIKEELYLIQNGTDYESNFHGGVEEGEVIQGPWAGDQSEKNAAIANEIENFIGGKMQEMYGNPMQWAGEQGEAFDRINGLLNILFPSGE